MMPAGPPVWICGDCHIGNLGPIGHTEGNAVVEMRDLDQTVIGNPAHDLLRLALSLAMSARSSDLPGVTTARVTEDLVAGYERAFEGEIASEEIADLPTQIRIVMKSAVKRTWKKLFDERIGDDRQRVPLGRRFWRLADRSVKAVKQLVDARADPQAGHDARASAAMSPDLVRRRGVLGQGLQLARPVARRGPRCA